MLTLTCCIIYSNRPLMLTAQGPSALQTPTTFRRVVLISLSNLLRVHLLPSSLVTFPLLRVAPLWVGLPYHQNNFTTPEREDLVLNFRQLCSRLSLLAPIAEVQACRTEYVHTGIRSSSD